MMVTNVTFARIALEKTQYMDAHLLIKLIKNGLWGLIIILLTSFNVSSQCNTFLDVTNIHSGVKIGNLSISGNQLSLEAEFNRTQAYDANYHGGDIVSKHLDPSDVNYLLRPNLVAITTNVGYYQIVAPCPIKLNKTYHVAMVYDGSSLKFYRDGFLIGQKPATGQLITNNYITTIGSPAAVSDYQFPEDFLGYINEVRIWNVARPQDSIRTYMNSSLPNPTTQRGLQAYYKFDFSDLIANLQGNHNWDGSLLGNASINETNPTCAAFIPDSCNIPVLPIVKFSSIDTVCLNTPVNMTNTSRWATSNYWNFCSAGINGTFDPLTMSPSCSTTSVNVLSSSSPTPPQIIYSTPGKYNICLLIDEGLPTQASFCKPIVVQPPSTALDFTFVQDNCNPEIITFHNNSIPLSGFTFSYDFGDASSATEPNLITSTKYYNNYNNYTVTLTNTTGCADTIHKIIPVHLKTDSLIVNNDTTICKYSTVQLNAINASSYCWRPTSGLSNSTISNPMASPKTTTTYYLNAQINGSNLVYNGDFSMGNTGFTTDYNYTSNGYPIGTYTVDTTAITWHPFLSRCHDHTSGNGKMMIINGANNQGAAIWQQLINNLQPNTDYLFSVWLQSLSIANPAQIQFYIDGQPIGIKHNAFMDTCVWQQPLTSWNSGNHTSATIAIVNQDTIGAGNDFALDDISFSSTAVITDSITVKVNSPSQSPTVDTTICLGQSVQLTANLANSYQWKASPYLSSLNIQNPVAKPTISTVFNVNRYNFQGCYITDTFNVNVLTIKSSLDFSFSEDICNPLNIQFKNESTNSNAYSWSFGDGNISSLVNPQNTYNNYGSYKVTLQNTDGCIDSITKYVTVNIHIDSIISTKDTAICGGAPFRLQTLSALDYCWHPTFGLSDPTIANPIATTSVPITYYVNAKVVGTNLMINGDFSQNTTGFTSDYQYAFPNTIEDQYYVGTNAQLWNGGMSACGDHTTGKGNYLMINGANLAGTIAWEEKNILIQPNTNYAFSAWVEALFPDDPAILQFSINGHKIGHTFQAPGPKATCLWRQFYVVWNSGNNTTADISLINLNTIKNGNDFGVDDISFAKLDIVKDSINISIKPTPTVVILNKDTAICTKDSFQLKAIGAIQYQWNSNAAVSNYSIPNPIAYPIKDTKYIVTGTNSQSCSGTDSFFVTVNPLPTFILTKDTSICFGNSIGFSIQSSTVNDYSWYPQTYLSSSNDPNPIAKPTESIKYYVSVTEQDHFCSNKDSVKVTVMPLPTVNTRTDTSICLLTNTKLFTNSNADHVRWFPHFGLSDYTTLSPLDTAIALGPNKYMVTAYSKQGCISTDSVTITGLTLPEVKVEKDSLSICEKTSVQLNIHTLPTSNLTYNWMPNNGLNFSSIANPVASPNKTITYHVYVTAPNKCMAEDSVFLKIRQLPIFTINPVDSELCKGDSMLIKVSGGDKYHWLDNQVKYQDSSANFVHPITTTTYQVSITDTLCKIATPIYSTITINNPPVISITKSNDIDCFHTSATLTAKGGVRFQWSPIDSIFSINGETIIVAPNQTAIYSVKAFSEMGCIADSSIRVNVVKGDIGNGFPAANAFTPTIKDNNSCFGVKEWGHLDNLQLSIFNRAGQRIYYTTSLDGCWDGTVNGNMQDAGTYIYEIKATTLCGIIYRKGTLVLIR